MKSRRDTEKEQKEWRKEEGYKKKKKNGKKGGKEGRIQSERVWQELRKKNKIG